MEQRKVFTAQEMALKERADQCNAKLNQLLQAYSCTLSVGQLFIDGVIATTEIKVVAVDRVPKDLKGPLGEATN